MYNKNKATAAEETNPSCKISYRFRIYPNEEQQAIIIRNIGHSRFLYNYLVKETNKVYEKTKKIIIPDITPIKKLYPFLKEADSLSLVEARNRVERAYRDKFNPNSSTNNVKPKKKTSREESYQTFRLEKGNNVYIKDGMLKVPKMKPIKMVIHRPIPDEYRLKNVSIIKGRDNKFFASILFEFDTPSVEKIEPRKVVGLDYALKKFYVSSDGVVPEFTNNSQRHYKLRKRKYDKLNRLKKGSNNYYKQFRKARKANQKIVNCRKDMQHKLSLELAREYDFVAVERLSLKGIRKSPKYKYRVIDGAFYQFCTFLEYKMKNQGKYFVKIETQYPSSKTCHACGNKKDTLHVSERVYYCKHCGLEMDRDLNAAINIRRRGMELAQHKYPNVNFKALRD